MRTYKIIGLKVIWNEQLQKKIGGYLLLGSKLVFG